MKNKFQQIESRLEKTLEEMKNPNLSIDDLMAKAQKAYELIREAKQYLSEAETKIEIWNAENMKS